LLAVADGCLRSPASWPGSSRRGCAGWPHLAAHGQDQLFVHSACQAAALLVEW